MNRTALIVFLFALTLFVPGCAQKKPEPVNKPITENISRDEYVLYRDVLSQEFGDKGNAIIKEKTLVPHNASGLDSKIRGQMESAFGKAFDGSLLDRFIEVNQKPALINQDILSYKSAIVLTAETEKELFTNDQIYYEDFRAKFPSPSRMVEFSRPAFDAGMTRALVYFGKIFYSGKESEGQYLFLKKVKGKWVVDKRLSAWKV